MALTAHPENTAPRPPLSRWVWLGPLLAVLAVVGGVWGWSAWKTHQFEEERLNTPPMVVTDLKLKLLWIPAGTFLMGTEDEAEWLKSLKKKYNEVKPSGWTEWKLKEVTPAESPAHMVMLTKAFYLGETEVTQAQWEAVMGKNPSAFKGPNRPVEQVSWGDCVEFCKKLTERERAAGRIGSKQLFRLPTEAEWEYACRAGSGGDFCFGDDQNRLGEYAWFGGNPRDGSREVGTKRANGWGLHDMHGNVLEWCADVWDAKAYGKRSKGCVAVEWTVALAGPDVEYFSDGDKLKNLPLRVGRGGSFSWRAMGSRSSIRLSGRPSHLTINTGFRLALEPGPVVLGQ